MRSQLRSRIAHVAARQRSASGAAVSAIAVQIAASAARPRAMRAALLGGAWLGALAMFEPDAARGQEGPFAYVCSSIRAARVAPNRPR